MKLPAALILAFPLLAIAAQHDSPSNQPDEKKEKASAKSIQKNEGSPSAASAAQPEKNGGKAYYDSDYAWDEFYHRGRTVWACRGVQTGDFVSESLCAFQPKSDSHWPSKTVPGNWDGTERP
jgi:hypothetical protein